MNRSLLLKEKLYSTVKSELIKTKLAARNQSADETLEQYACLIKTMAKSAYSNLSGDVRDMLARDRFVEGIKCTEVRHNCR